MLDIDNEPGALVSRSVTQAIPLSATQFWSAFDDHLAPETTTPAKGGERPSAGLGSEVSFMFEDGTAREVLLQKDDTNRIWVTGISEPNLVFNYYRATLGVWDAMDTTRAKLRIDAVLAARDPGKRHSSLELIADALPTRIEEISRFVLRRDGARSHFELELNYGIERFWAIVSDWGNVEWVMGATGIERLGRDLRQIWFGSSAALKERLVSTDQATHTLVYSLLESPLPVRMYEGTLSLQEDTPGKTRVRYESVYLAREGVDPQAAKAEIEESFGQRVSWMKRTFNDRK